MTLVRKADHMPAGEVGFRHLWGRAKPVELTATAEAEPVALYDPIEPVLPLGLPFVRTVTSEGWFDWPALSDLFPRFFAGVVAGRDGFLMDTDIDRLRRRLADYFDSDLSHEEIARRYPRVSIRASFGEYCSIQRSFDTGCAAQTGWSCRSWIRAPCLPPIR